MNAYPTRDNSFFIMVGVAVRSDTHCRFCIHYDAINRKRKFTFLCKYCMFERFFVILRNNLTKNEKDEKHTTRMRAQLQ